MSNLYPQEYAQGRAMLASLNARLDVTLPDGEATALAMHLVNAASPPATVLLRIR